MSQSCKILIVDDSPEDRELYRRFLQKDETCTYTILETETGQAGLELWDREAPDVILLDYRLPDLNGLEFLAQLECPWQPPCLPVVMLTGLGNEAIAVKAMKAGAQDYLIKGQITPESLHLAVRGAIESVRLRTELQQRIERERLVSKITRQIHRSLNLNEILQTTVNGVREFLQTDRVLIFRLQGDGNGTITTESVGAEWTALLETSYFDPCFNLEYIESFRQGLVTIKNDIYDGSINPCHVELLAKLQVRANLVVPILQDDQLWGLLIAQHCVAPRVWQPLEVDLLKELATQVSIALQQSELYQQAQKELAERQRTERSLRDSEARFRQLAENIESVFWVSELPERRVSYISPAFERLWGLDRQQVYADCQFWLNCIHPEDRGKTEQAFQDLANQGRFDQEYRIILPDDQVRWVHDRCFPLCDATGAIYRLTGIAEDITQVKQDAILRQQMQEAEGRNEQQIRRILDSLFSFVGVLTPDGMLIEANRTALMAADLRPEDVLGQPFAETYWWSYSADTQAQLKAAIAQAKTGEVVRYDVAVRIKNDQLIIIDFTLVPIWNESGQVQFLIPSGIDITDRKRTEEQLRESGEQLRLALEAANLGMWYWDVKNDVLTWTDQAKAMFGIPLDTPMSMQVFLDAVHPDDRQLVQGVVHDLTSGQIHTELEYRALWPDGTVRWILAKGDCPYDSQGNLIATRGILVDITERKRIETERGQLLQQTQAAREEAERANQLKDEFLAVLSHELRSPLNPLLGWVKLLQSHRLDEAKTAEALAIIERNARLQAQLVEDLLDISRIMRGKLTLNQSPVDLVFVMSAAIETIRLAAEAKSIHIQPEFADGGRVLGDATRLQQVMWNLLSNAVKFTAPHGRVQIRLTQVDSQAQIQIADTGKGIDPAFLPHVFDYFRQEDSTTTRKFGGLGLGLAIARQIIELHGGTIQANSSGEGQGATFTVRLPLLQAPTAPELSSNSDWSMFLEEIQSLKGLRVLIVDDDDDTRAFITFLLEEQQIQVMQANSASAALQVLNQQTPDLILSDIGMPDMNGYELLQIVRQRYSNQGVLIPAIALTAYASELDQQRALAAGFQHHLAKPIEADGLIQAIARFSQRG